jgi:type IV pilus assembly protein PilX
MSRRRISLPTRLPHSQRGVVLLFSLIALVIMLIVAVALVRSFQSSLFTAGNIGFKRDLQNQSEAAVDFALKDFKPTNTDGKLNTAAKRSIDVPSRNYYAAMLPTDSQGIPSILNSGDDSTLPLAPALDPQYRVTIRYVIDRLCNATVVDETTAPPGACRLGDNNMAKGGDGSEKQGAESSAGGKAGAAPQSVVYRLSIRVTGPRNTQSFFQSTFTVPS